MPNAAYSSIAALVLATITAASPARAFPDRPINVVVPWGVGGGGDRVARVVADLMATKLGTSVPVINVTGAASQVGLNKVLSEQADGYNVVEITSDSYILFATANAKFKVSDFTALAILDQQPSGFFVRQDSPLKSWDDVVRAATKGAVTVAGSGFGTQSDVTVKYLNKKHGLKFVSIPFDDPGLRLTSVLGGHADLLYGQFGDIDTYLSKKLLRPILAFADQRLSEYPEIPTADEFKYRANITHFRALAVKHGTDPSQYAFLVEALNTASQSAEYKKMLAAESALPNSYISGKSAQNYVEQWVANLQSLMRMP
ncbi:MAG TPA: tripartite tricarboxylate transporter substrate-binding protein [Pseudolabrys sp.]|nr:tripartite tricarboxylate transporter substrate-binding protein [Pseudolabrys sp.]